MRKYTVSCSMCKYSCISHILVVTLFGRFSQFDGGSNQCLFLVIFGKCCFVLLCCCILYYEDLLRFKMMLHSDDIESVELLAVTVLGL